MPRIQANRESIDDRFSVLGFTVRTESPLFEVGVATDPGLFRAERRGQRNRRNFYSSRGIGAIRARRGEAVYLVPPDVLANFVGQPRLYFGLATYRENSRGKPDYVQAPGDGHMYVNMGGLTERGLRRLTGQARNGASYGAANGEDPSLDWGGDAAPQPVASAPAAPGAAAPVGAPPAPYDDGFGNFPAAEVLSPPKGLNPPAPPPLATAQELLLKPYVGGDGGLLEQLGFLLGAVPWFAGVEDTTGFPHSAICRTYAATPLGATKVGTAFYIGRNLLLTAAHVVHDKTSIDIVPGKNGAGGGTHEPFGRFTALPADWVEHESYEPNGRDASAFDFAVIRASRPAPHDRWFTLEELRQSRPEGVVVCGYSTSSRQLDRLSRLVSAAIDSEKQHLHSGHVRFLGTEETFDYDVQTLPGASGAPVYTIYAGDAPAAVVSGVHVAGGGKKSDTTNKGCRLTDAKIAWIRTRAAELGVASAMSMRAPQQKTPSRTAHALAARSHPQGLLDLLPVDLKLRVFIPAPAVVATVPVVGGEVPFVSAKGGDGRGFQLDGGTSRAEITARFHFGDGKGKPKLTDVKRSFGESTNYDTDDTLAVPGKPEWYRNLRPGAKPLERGTQTVADERLRVALGGSANDGIVSMAENAVVVSFDLHAADPIVTAAPDIDATLALLLKVKGGRVEARVRGGHDEFPAYELYANGVLVYSYDPVAAGGTPLGLFGDGNWDVNPETDYIDAGPATEYRVIGPVRIKGAQAQAMADQSIAVHWDTVPYYPQSGGASCWAASAAMIVGWRDDRPVADTEIADKVPVFDAYKNGLFPAERRALADAWDLVPEPPASYTVDSWARLLQACGPVYVDMTWDTSGNGGHARVLVGMETDGAPDGSGTTMYLHDPWPGTPGMIKLAFADFLALYEGRTGNEGGELQYQILHAGALPAGRRAMNAAPFALTTPEAASPQSERHGIALAPAPAAVGYPNATAHAQNTIAGAVIGKVIDKVTDALGNALVTRLTDEGAVTCELDNYVPKEPASDALPAKAGRTIEIKDWPKVQAPMALGGDSTRFPGTAAGEHPDVRVDRGERYTDQATVAEKPALRFGEWATRDVFANFAITWSYTGVALGRIDIDTIGSQTAPGFKLKVKAVIRDEAYQGEARPFAKKLVRFEYKFSGPGGFRATAIVAVRLFGNGARTIDFAWQD